MSIFKPTIYFIIAISLVSCHKKTKSPLTFKYELGKVEKPIHTDSSYLKILNGYKVGLDSQMNTVIGKTPHAFIKEKPESGLGNLLNYMIEVKIKQQYKFTPDLVLLNYGGLRNDLPNGDITVGNFYEVMPFDNTIVLMEIDSSVVYELADKIAKDNGVPIWGLGLVAKNGKIESIDIQNQKLSNRKYTIAIPDYVANGGDNYWFFLRGTNKQETGILIRDLFLEVFPSIKQEKLIELGKNLNKIVLKP